jgi:LacI family transcriptional regulator
MDFTIDSFFATSTIENAQCINSDTKPFSVMKALHLSVVPMVFLPEHLTFGPRAPLIVRTFYVKRNFPPGVSMSITQAQLAEKIGVSQVAVSLAFKTGHNRLNDKTRHQILQAAEKFGYRPNASARSVRQGRFNGVCLLNSAQLKRSYFSGPMLDTIYQALEQCGYHLSFTRADDQQLAVPENLPKLLAESQSDGFLVNIIKQIPERLPELLTRLRLPAVWLNVMQDYDCVRHDDFGAGVQMTEHLLSLGHKRILYINPSYDATDTHYSGQERLRGYEHAMRQAGLSPQSITGRKIPGEKLLRTALDVLTPADRPTAVVDYGEGAAIAFLQAAERLGLSVPTDLSLAGLSCNQPDSYHGSFFTSMQHDYATFAQASVDMLMHKIRRPRCRPAASIVVPMHLCVARSTATAMTI